MRYKVQAELAVQQKRFDDAVDLYDQALGVCRQLHHFRSSGPPANERQSLIHMDKNGNIFAAEIPEGVEECLARLSLKGQ